jgi:hypothetical protein
MKTRWLTLGVLLPAALVGGIAAGSLYVSFHIPQADPGMPALEAELKERMKSKALSQPDAYRIIEADIQSESTTRDYFVALENSYRKQALYLGVLSAWIIIGGLIAFRKSN